MCQCHDIKASSRLLWFKALLQNQKKKKIGNYGFGVYGMWKKIPGLDRSVAVHEEVNYSFIFCPT